jgi:hypothetical protein
LLCRAPGRVELVGRRAQQEPVVGPDRLLGSTNVTASDFRAPLQSAGRSCLNREQPRGISWSIREAQQDAGIRPTYGKRVVLIPIAVLQYDFTVPATSIGRAGCLDPKEAKSRRLSS